MNGLILIDNVLWKGQVVDSHDTREVIQAIRSFNQKLSQDPRVEISIIPIGDGMTVARKIK